MSSLSIVLVAFALAADAVAVAAANGARHHQLPFYRTIKIAFWFGFFQFLMPIIGYYFGETIGSAVESFDHWLAFGLLSFLGAKVLIESFGTVDEKEIDALDLKTILLLAVATSVDALVVGISLSFVTDSILSSALIIGFVTFVSSALAVKAGKIFGEKFGKKTELLAGFILIAIGAKILIEHLV